MNTRAGDSKMQDCFLYYFERWRLLGYVLIQASVGVVVAPEPSLVSTIPLRFSLEREAV